MSAPIDPRVSRLLDASGIDPTYQAQMGCRYAAPEEVAAVSGLPLDKVSPNGAIAIPYPGTKALDGSQFYVYRQIDCAEGDPKYLGSPDQSTEIHVPINFEKNKGNGPLVITEGEKKAALLDSLGIPALGIRGVDMWFDASDRAAERECGASLSAKTSPHPVLLREALAAESVLVLGDSDCCFKPQAKHGLDTLRQSLLHHIELLRPAQPDFNPMRMSRNTTVAFGICNPRWTNVKITRTDTGKVTDVHADSVKVGVDDLFLYILADVSKQSAKYEVRPNVDNHSHDRVKAIHRLKELLQALHVAGIGNTNFDLALMVANTNYRQHAYRPKSWMHYSPTKGIWSESTSDEQLAAPPRLAERYSTAAKVLYVDTALAAGELAMVKDETLAAKATAVYEWITDAKETAKNTANSALALKTTRHQKDILAQTKHRLSVPMEFWDADRDSFVCANGVINLHTGVLSPHSPEHLVTTGSAVVYDVTAECPRWLAFLEQAQTDKAVRRYLQAIMGYALTGRTNMEQIWFLKGKGGNGKGTFIETLRFIFGDYAAVASPTLVLRQHNSDPHPTNLAALRGKHWATVSELPLYGELDSAVMKKLTGGDKQTARKMHQDFSDFHMQATITVDTNDVPRLQEYSPATRRRVKIIDWLVEFEGREDNDLKDSLKLEASGIFNWLLKGARLYYASELKKVPEAVKEATAEFWAGMNSVGQWLREFCVIEAEVKKDGKPLCTDSTPLCKSFDAWSKDNKIPPVGKKSFLSKLRLQDNPGIQTKESNGKTWVLGLRLKTQAELDEPYVEKDEPIPTKPMATATNAYSDSTTATLPVKKCKFERVS